MIDILLSGAMLVAAVALMQWRRQLRLSDAPGRSDSARRAAPRP